MPVMATAAEQEKPKLTNELTKSKLTVFCIEPIGRYKFCVVFCGWYWRSTVTDLFDWNIYLHFAKMPFSMHILPSLFFLMCSRIHFKSSKFTKGRKFNLINSNNNKRKMKKKNHRKSHFFCPYSNSHRHTHSLQIHLYIDEWITSIKCVLFILFTFKINRRTLNHDDKCVTLCREWARLKSNRQKFIQNKWKIQRVEIQQNQYIKCYGLKTSWQHSSPQKKNLTHLRSFYIRIVYRN